MFEWSKSFSDPHRAEQLFVEMYAENSRTAFRYANNNAQVFGKTELSRPSSFPTSKTFKLTAACMTSPLAYPRIGIEAAWRKIYNLTAEHKHPRQTKEREREIER